MQQNPGSPVKKEDIPSAPDKKIDEDFPGFPSGQSAEKLITPKTEEEKKLAQVNIKDGEKVNRHEDEIDEARSDGSGGAFDGTENSRDDDYDNSRRGK